MTHYRIHVSYCYGDFWQTLVMNVKAESREAAKAEASRRFSSACSFPFNVLGVNEDWHANRAEVTA